MPKQSIELAGLRQDTKSRRIKKQAKAKSRSKADRRPRRKLKKLQSTPPRTHHGRTRQPQPQKTLIGVLASRDSLRANDGLVSMLEHLYNHSASHKLEAFHFVFTGGTYKRVFEGNGGRITRPLSPSAASWLHDRCGITVLPEAAEGGVVILSYLMTQQQCSIIWPLFGSEEMHWLRPENLALMRLADQWHVKRLMNRGSVMAWFDKEVDSDTKRNLQAVDPIKLILRSHASTKQTTELPNAKYVRPANAPVGGGSAAPCHTRLFKDMTIALIAHDEMKGRMIEFAIDHEPELRKFRTILATGTTGREVAAATSPEIGKKMHRYHSGPKGGDIEIATEILRNVCDLVVFFVDPLRPHPHAEDIRVVFQACMIKDRVVMITNEMHAREFMTHVVRGNERLALYS